MFEQVLGQTVAKRILCQAMERGRVSHAYLFHGPAGTGKTAMARLFAQALFCEGDAPPPCGQCIACRKIVHGNYADLHVLEPDGGSLKIEQFRHLQKEIYVKPTEGKGHVYIIRDAEKMTAAAANSFLKVLEEPLPGVHFLLLTASLHAMLATIISRCQLVPFTPYPAEEIAAFMQAQHGIDLREARKLALLAKGNLCRAEEIAADRGKFLSRREEAFLLWQCIEGKNFSLYELAGSLEEKKEGIEEIFRFFLEWYRDALVYSQTGERDGISNFDKVNEIVQIGQRYPWQEIVRKLYLLEESRSRLRQNVNFRIEIEYLLLHLRQRAAEVGRI